MDVERKHTSGKGKSHLTFHIYILAFVFLYSEKKTCTGKHLTHKCLTLEVEPSGRRPGNTVPQSPADGGLFYRSVFAI